MLIGISISIVYHNANRNIPVTHTSGIIPVWENFTTGNNMSYTLIQNDNLSNALIHLDPPSPD